jgi:UPF0176 protein
MLELYTAFRALASRLIEEYNSAHIEQRQRVTMLPTTVLAFYKFTNLEKPSKLKAPLLALCHAQKVKGTILLAQEGINGTIAGPAEGIQAFLDFLEADGRFENLSAKKSYEATPPFYRMKIKIKREIVTLGQPEVDPNKIVGTYVKPEAWNHLIEDPEVILVDTRNIYEYEVGTFKNALNPNTVNFREFPDYVAKHLDPTKHKKVAMFCTGGIRCEKASSFMLQQGFEEVYHLEGGILKYLEDVPLESSLWQGECFVFDNRVTVDHHLQKGNYDLCHACRHPVSETDKQSDKYIPEISCPHCHDTQSEENRARALERAKQMELAQQRGYTHLGESQ